jgi:hypothetical protein
MKTKKSRGAVPRSPWHAVAGPMRLGCELLLPYPGFCGFDGLCHVRVFVLCHRVPWRAPVVLVGGLDDNPGTSVTNVIEVVAAAVRRQVFPEGSRFVLVEHYADRLGDSSRPAAAAPLSASGCWWRTRSRPCAAPSPACAAQGDGSWLMTRRSTPPPTPTRCC